MAVFEPMTRGARRAFGVLLALVLALCAASILFTVTYYHREQAAQQRQGQVFERKLCTTLGDLAALRPPGGTAADQSREYLARQHEVLAELGPDVGCKAAP